MSEIFRGTRRFQLRRPLGFGGMGVVYQAYDREREMDVALKVLLGVDVRAVRALKREFRALTDVSHPNLIGFFDLINDEGTWFITMELVDGVDLIAHLRGERTAPAPAATGGVAASADPTWPGSGAGLEATLRPPAAPPEIDSLQLRTLFRQLARAIAAVHGLGRLHCDIKPSNVLVTPAGRVVLLDFGLVAELRSRAALVHAPGPMAGTPAYVAPEQWRGEEATAASDWYSFGVMLFEALAGTLPFAGSSAEIQAGKEQGAFDQSGWPAGVPVDLRGLCQQLLSPAPADRPSPAAILATLARAEDEEPAITLGAQPPEVFVGRLAELERLTRAYQRSRSGESVTVHIEGPSGIGKSALVTTLLGGLRDAGALVLQGRCYERESIPFKALDAIVESLAGHLAATGFHAGGLPPEDAEALAGVFPVLKDVPGLAAPAELAAVAPEPIRLRQRAAAALRAIVGRLARRQGLVLCIDDAHWGDTDSAQVIAALLAPPDPPALLLILVHRNDVAAPAAFVSGVERARQTAAARLTVSLDPLSEPESLALASSLLRPAGCSGSAPDVAREAKGNPFFLTELTRFCVERAAAGGAAGGILAVTLDEVLRRRLGTVPRAARRLLEVIALAGKPIARRLAEVAAGLEAAEATSMGLLRATHFVRTFGLGATEVVETFHDRVRESLVGALDPELRRDHHRRLAEAAEAGSAEPEADFLAEHFRAAGIRAKAFRYAVLAARRARALYAVHDSVRHWESAVALLAVEPALAGADEQGLRREHADALRNAGLFERAIAALEEARARAPSGNELAHIGVDLGRVFQEMGRPQDSVRELEAALALLGRPVPAGPLRLLFSTVAALVAQGWAGRALPRRRRSGGSERIKRQLLALLVLLRIYFFVDRRKLGWGILTSIRLARGVDDPVSRARAESYYIGGLLGLGARARALAASRRAAALAGGREGLAAALNRAHMGMFALFDNDLAAARAHLGAAADGLERAGEYWELQAWRHLESIAMFLSGELARAERGWERVAEHARAVSSRPHLAWTQAWLPYSRFTSGSLDAAAAHSEIERSYALSVEVDDLANQMTALMNASAIAVRAEQPEEAAALAVRTFGHVSRYQVQIPFVQRALVDAAEAALYAVEQGATSQPRGRLLRLARRAYRRALRIGRTYGYLRGPGLRVKARYLALTRGSAAAERCFAAAIATLAATPNRLELVVALHDAAAALPGQRATLLPRARELAREIGAAVELARLARLE